MDELFVQLVKSDASTYVYCRILCPVHNVEGSTHIDIAVVADMFNIN